MNELIRVNYDNDTPTVSGRELHEFLEVETPYRIWFPRMCEYGFNETVDFNPYKNVRVENEGNREVKRTMTDHQLTIEMAKEICMLQRNDKGKQARTYFIELEKQWNSPEAVMARALKLANMKIENLTATINIQNQRIGELQSKASYVDIILRNKGLVTITQIAKDYGMSGKKMNDFLHDYGIQYKQSGQWLLYRDYHDKGYTHSFTVNITRKDGTPDVRMETKWTQKGRLFIYELLKGVGILPVIEQK